MPNGFWTRLDLTPRLPELQLPALHVVGYYDFFSRESVANFVIMQQQARDAADPDDGSDSFSARGTTARSGSRKVAESRLSVLQGGARRRSDSAQLVRSPSEAGRRGARRSRFRRCATSPWGTTSGMTRRPGRRRALTPTSFYLHSDGRANTRRGDGRLSIAKRRPALSRAMRFGPIRRGRCRPAR
jgi:predicted acyl esterase